MNTRIITTLKDSDGATSGEIPAGAIPYGEPYSSIFASGYRVDYQDYEIPDDTPDAEGSTLSGYTALVD